MQDLTHSNPTGPHSPLSAVVPPLRPCSDCLGHTQEECRRRVGPHSHAFNPCSLKSPSTPDHVCLTLEHCRLPRPAHAVLFTPDHAHAHRPALVILSLLTPHLRPLTMHTRPPPCLSHPLSPTPCDPVTPLLKTNTPTHCGEFLQAHRAGADCVGTLLQGRLVIPQSLKQHLGGLQTVEGSLWQVVGSGWQQAVGGG